ncbi:HEPN domain-containing protein [Thermococcus barophilus]|uniref:HEPN domain-containing protein n=2 Tax=Thermococcus barophilus TaxID=55802 RepID=A0A0S1XBJ9_THEBA|nr:HEPN domain-containing protein [Thermococcus barophilus]ADT84024.1 HEPN domain protein [Thermococcus barophilus MP]ALM75171.1 hypothetical protein TBCH5v1_1247 [Thermococcus barophilus]
MKTDVKDWIRKADEDLKASEILLEQNLYALSCFHAQQAVEKYLKAFLLEHDREISKTHNIKFLLNQCCEIDKSFRELFKSGVHYLTEYAVEVRYPGIYEPDREEAKDALRLAKVVKEFVLRKLMEE